MKIFLLNVGRPPEPARRFFYPDDPGDDPALSPTHGGLRGWAEVRLGRLKEGVQHSQNGAARLARRVWGWLQKHTHPDETLLARLRSAREIEVYHPASLRGDEVADAWSGFLDRSRRRHWPWFLANAAAAPLTVLLAPLPGPNVVGYWIAYRAIHHWLILTGLSRARRGRIETRFRPADALEVSVGAGGGVEAPGFDRPGCEAPGLAEFLERQGVRPPGERTEAPAR